MFLRCGDQNKVLSVVEPTMCQYELRFETHLACPIDAFLGKYHTDPKIAKAMLTLDINNLWLNKLNYNQSMIGKYPQTQQLIIVYNICYAQLRCDFQKKNSTSPIGHHKELRQSLEPKGKILLSIFKCGNRIFVNECSLFYFIFN